MAFVTYPLDDIDYSSEDAELFHCTRSSGIYAEDDFSFSVTGADNIISLGPGIGWIRNAKFKGKVIAMKEETKVDMGLPDAAYPRYDVMAIQFTANGNGTAIVVKNGTPASSPALPAISQTEAVYELYILSVRREVGATAITAKDITDLRLNPTYCGLMADSITRIDTSAINAQFLALVNQLREEIANVKAGTAYVMKSGDTMTGPLNIPAPSNSTHAANKEYVDGKHATAVVSLLANRWSGSGPYTQVFNVSGITAEDAPHYGVVYSNDNATRIAEKEAFAMVDDLETGSGTVTFTCFEEKPEIDLVVQLEVNR